MRTLCPHCGTPNTHAFGKLPACTKCGKRLPLRLPRGFVYGVRTVAKPSLLVGLVLVSALAVPAYREYRHNQRMEYWLNLSASSGSNLPATHTPR